MKTWHLTLCTRLAVCAALLCLLIPASVQASEKTGIYVTPKFNVGFMNWQVHDETDAGTDFWPKQTGAVTHGGSGSFDFSSGKNSTLWGGALAIGYDFYPRFDLPLRLEVEYGMYSNASGSSEYTMPTTLANQIIGVNWNDKRGTFVDLDLKLQNIQTLLFNAYWDFHNSTNFTPYIGAGLGLAFIQVDGSATTYFHAENRAVSYEKSLGVRNNTNFAWQVGAGCSYALTDNIALDLGYRFMSLGSADSYSIPLTDVNGATNNNIVISANGRAEAKNIYMHQIALGLRISF